MKKTTLSISYDEEKLSALKMYLEQKGTAAEDELVKALDTLYAKTVPAGVREFIGMKSGAVCMPTGKSPRRQKPSPSSAVGETISEVNENKAH